MRRLDCRPRHGKTAREGSTPGLAWAVEDGPQLGMDLAREHASDLAG